MTSAAAALATILFHIPLWFAARQLVRDLLRPGSRGAELRDTFLTFCILWRLETLLLGALGWLQPIPVFALSVVVFLGVALRPPKPGQDTAPIPRTASKWDVATAGGWIAVVSALAVFRILALPDPYDSLTYHLMLPAHWLKTGSLSLYATTFGDIAPTYTPAAVEGFFLALMLPTGSDLLARVGQLPFLLAGAHCVASLVSIAGARERLPRWAPALAATAFLLLHEQLKQGTGSMVDVATSTYFLASLTVLLRWRQEPQRWTLLLFGGALAGMFLGSRFQSLLYVPLLLMPVLGPVLASYRRGLLHFLIPLVLLGAFPFLRNLWLTGNPVYPVTVPLIAATLPGLFSSQATHNNSYHISLRQFWGGCDYFFLKGGLALAAIGTIGPVFGRNRQLFWLTGLAALIVLGHLFVVPYNANYRFLFAPWGLLIAAAVAACTATPWLRYVIVAAVAWFTFESLELLPRQFRLDNDEGLGLFRAGFTATFVLGAAIAWGLHGLNARVRSGACLFCGLAIVAALGAVNETRQARMDQVYARDWGKRFAKYAPEWQQIEGIEGSARIAYAGLNLPYPLCGLDQRHTVFSVPLDGSSPDLLPHELRAALGDTYQPSDRTVEITVGRTTARPKEWIEQLLASEVDYLALYADTMWQPIELRWAEESPRLFERISRSDAKLVIYRVKRQ